MEVMKPMSIMFPMNFDDSVAFCVLVTNTIHAHNFRFICSLADGSTLPMACPRHSAFSKCEI